MLKKCKFIKPNIPFNPKRTDYAPMFRKKFKVEQKVENAYLYVCGLGVGHYYLNGKRVSEDKFVAPVSNYSKTVWYNRYEITEQLQTGDNLFAAVCGNGWYNEALDTAWDFDKADWRDVPKLIAALEINGQVVVSTDETWKCKDDPAVLYNQLRSGEIFDSRLYEEAWMTKEYNDSTWEYAKEDDREPSGVFRLCDCEPIRECEELCPVQVTYASEGRIVYDFGKNISGYVRLTTNQTAGDEIKIEYAEQMQDSGDRELNDMQKYYHDREFHVDRFICCGRKFTWSPRFSYYGFRYIILSGIRDVNQVQVKAVFVHQDVAVRSSFSCSNNKVNQLFQIGQNATLCNMFYSLTDCPTREKLGWMNDAQASIHQILTDFESEKFFGKWFVDICDAMKENGQLPGIVPTGGWGYHWGNGPVSDGTLFELPYRVYLHTGNDGLLKRGLPYFKQYLNYLSERVNTRGELEWGLDDWAAPVLEDKVDNIFINAVLEYKFLKITELAMQLCREETEEIRVKSKSQRNKVMNTYIDDLGRCRIQKQTAVAMMIYFDLYEDIEPLKQQLKDLVKQADCHHDCGMVGLRYLYTALDKCGLQEYGYRILCSEGFPSYMDWLKDGATALYERWNMTESKNHHMYSHFMSWLINTVLGIKPDISYPGFQKLQIAPFFTKELTFAKGYCDTVRGRVEVAWKRVDEKIVLTITVPKELEVYYDGTRLSSRENVFEIV